MSSATPHSANVVRRLELADGEVNFYQRQGYLVLPGFIEPAALPALVEELWAVMRPHGLTPERLSQATETADKLRQICTYLRGSKLDELINGENTLAIAARLIGGPATRYLPFTAVKAGGGGGQFHFHQDNSYTRHDPAMGSINIWVALVDMTPANGCLQVVPQSHLAGQLPAAPSDDGDSHRQVQVNPADAWPVRMRAGDAIAFTRLTVHGSGPNHTQHPRLAYALQYHRADVRFLDPATDTWRLLADTPRFQTPPVEKL